MIAWLDTETGGLDPQSTDLLTIGIYAGGRGRSWSIARDSYRTTPKALEVNGIDLDVLRRRGKPVEVVDEEITASLGRLRKMGYSVIGGQNLAFDLRFLTAQLPQVAAALPRFRTTDTQIVARFLQEAGALDVPSTSLAALCAHFGVQHGGHEALADAISTAGVYDAMLELVRELKGGQ